MPNWCYNTASFYHPDSKQIDRLIKGFKEGKLFEEWIPMPDDFEGDWYSWNTSRWGTKWDVGGNEDCTEDYERISDTEVSFYFDSAWAPPLYFYQTLQEGFDFSIEAYYHEPGMQFCGKFDDEGDHCYDTEDYDDIPEDIREEMSIEENEELEE